MNQKFVNILHEGMQFRNGDKVYLKPEYADSDPLEKYTVSQCDEERDRCWIGDKTGAGWFVDFDQITKTKPSVKRR